MLGEEGMCEDGGWSETWFGNGNVRILVSSILTAKGREEGQVIGIIYKGLMIFSPKLMHEEVLRPHCTID